MNPTKFAFEKHKRKLKDTVPYTKTGDIFINDKFFNFYDNHKTNRIIGFAPPNDLKCIAASMSHHADGTFHTATRYKSQLYAIHSYFPQRKI